MMTRKEIVFFTGVLSLILFVIVFAIQQNSTRKVTALRIAFENQTPLYLTDTLVNKMLKQKGGFTQDQYKDSLDLSMLEATLEGIPAIANSEVFIYPDGLLGVRVEERTPFLKVVGKQTYFLDALGHSFTLPLIKKDSLPVVKGQVQVSDHKELIALVERLQNDRYFGQQALEIIKDEKGYQLHFSAFGYPVKLGQPNRLSEKINKLKAFRAYQLQQEKVAVPRYINLAFEGQVVVAN